MGMIRFTNIILLEYYLEQEKLDAIQSVLTGSRRTKCFVKVRRQTPWHENYRLSCFSA